MRFLYVLRVLVLIFSAGFITSGLQAESRPPVAGMIINESIFSFASYSNGAWGAVKPMTSPPPESLVWSVAESGYPATSVKMTLSPRKFIPPLHAFPDRANQIAGIAVSTDADLSAMTLIKKDDPVRAKLALFIAPILRKLGEPEVPCDIWMSERPVAGVSFLNVYCSGQKEPVDIQASSIDGKGFETLQVTHGEAISMLVGAMAMEGGIYYFSQDYPETEGPPSYCIAPLPKGGSNAKYCYQPFAGPR